MFKVSSNKNKIKQIKPNDPLWLIVDGLYLTPRAGFQINLNCPKNYRMIISECINNGWLQPVAYMRDNEHMWEKIQS